SWIPGVDGVLLGNRRQDLVLAVRLVRVLAGELLDLRERIRAGERREVVELRREERVLVVDLQISEELLRRSLVRRELPDRVTAHHMLEAASSCRPTRDRADVELL